MNDSMTANRQTPLWLWAAAAFGIAWNVFGLVQLTDFILQTRASLMMKGMTSTAADLYYGLPVWMKAAFAVGSLGGLLGSMALGSRRRSAIAIFAASLAGYIALYVGDFLYGVFVVVPGQQAILSLVVAIAVALLVAGTVAGRLGLLR